MSGDMATFKGRGRLGTRDISTIGRQLSTPERDVGDMRCIGSGGYERES